STAQTNVKLTEPGTVTLTGNTFVNSLIIVSTLGPAVIAEAGFTLTVGDTGPGAILIAGTTNQTVTISGGTVAYAGNEGLIFNGNTSAAGTTISSVISGTAGLTLGGLAAADLLTLSSATGNSVTGTTTLDGGTLSIPNSSDLGNTALKLVNG